MPVENKQENNPITWLEQYGDALFGFARARVHNTFTAEDLLQETLLAAYRSRSSFSGQSTVKTWLTGILKHKIADYYRKLKPEQSDENIDDFSYSMENLFDEREKWKIKPGNWGEIQKMSMMVESLCPLSMPAWMICLRKCPWHIPCASWKELRLLRYLRCFKQKKTTAGSYCIGQECC